MQSLRRASIVVAPAAVVLIAVVLLSAQTPNPLAGGLRSADFPGAVAR